MATTSGRQRRAARRGVGRRALQAELRDRDRRGEAINLEVELSYSAGMAASAVAVAWFLFGHARDVGFESIAAMSLCVLWMTVIELFAAGLVLHLLYRGAWMAACLLTRNDPTRWSPADPEAAAFRAAIASLDRHCRAVFHGAFRFLHRGTWGALVVTAVFMAFSELGPVPETIGVVVTALAGIMALLELLGAVPFLDAARRYRSWLHRRSEEALRLLGLWWVTPPESRVSEGGPVRHTLLFVLLFLTFVWNTEMVIVPTITTERPVYSKATDSHALIHFHQGGVRGDDASDVSWSIRTAIRPKPAFRRLTLNHFVAPIPLADLEPGVHELEARVVIRQVTEHARGKGGFIINTEPVQVRFVVTP